MSNKKYIKDYSYMSERKKSNVEDLTSVQAKYMDGLGGRNLVEPLPNYLRADSEKVISNSNNSWIVLGRDRPSNRLSGYGGRGDTQAASVDIVAGRLGHLASEIDPVTGEDAWTDPDMRADAARIYLSQKTDVDKNFSLATGRVGDYIARSAVAIKADGVRIIGREGIKLITRTESTNSQGGEIAGVYGIDLIAGNNSDDLQPMVKGDNLAEALDRQMHHLKSLTSIVEVFLTEQMKFNSTIMMHTHIGNLGTPTLPSVELVADGLKTSVNLLLNGVIKMPIHRANIEMYKMNYLTPFGSKYINSRHNNTN